jgi:acyl-CoA reductase-like NAD-dependent aldehyde dehydrogenase
MDWDAINWDAMSAIGETVGAIAVIVSIIYLAIQVRSNTRATRAAAGFDATHSWASFNEVAIGLDASLKAEVARAYDPQSQWQDFSPAQRADIGLLHRALFQKLEGQYILYRYAFLDEGIWKARSSWASALIAIPFFAEWWSQEKEQYVYSEDFASAIEAISTTPVGFVGSKEGRS